MRGPRLVSILFISSLNHIYCFEVVLDTIDSYTVPSIGMIPHTTHNS
jgi:hypothetical protein